QIRISADNVVSFGTGDEPFQRARVESATTRTDAGYRVEVAVSLLESGGAGSFQGLDLQVNDASNGARTGIRNWADPSGAGYQSTARWGVAQLVSAVAAAEPRITVTPGSVEAGGTVDVELSGFAPETEIDLELREPSAEFSLFALAVPAVLATVTTDADGTASARITIPADTAAGAYEIAALQDGAALAAASVTVTAAAVGAPGGDPDGDPAANPAGDDDLANTGSELGAWLWLAIVMLLAGGIIVRARRAATLG
ncbi:MAG: sugar-binding protein, partial [Mycetocola sp.]